MTAPQPVIRLASPPASGLAVSPAGVWWSGPSHDAPGAPTLSWRIGPAGAESLVKAVAEGDAEVVSAWVSRIAMPQGLLSALARRCCALQPGRARRLAEGERPSDLRWARTLGCVASSRKCFLPEMPGRGRGLLVRGEGGGLIASLSTPAPGGSPPLGRLLIGAPPGPQREASVELLPGSKASLPLAVGPWGEGVAVAIASPPKARPGLLGRLLPARDAVLSVWVFSPEGLLAAEGACLAPPWALGSEVTALLAHGSTLFAQTAEAEIELALALVGGGLASPHREGQATPEGAPPFLLAPPASPARAAKVVPRSIGGGAEPRGRDVGALDVAGASFFVDDGESGGRASVRASDGAVLTLAHCRIGAGGVEASRHATVFLVGCDVAPGALSADRSSHIVTIEA